MRSKMNPLAGVSILLLFGCVSFAAQSSTAQEKKNKKMVLNCWHELVAVGKLDAAPKCLADDYVEHDPNIGGGRKEFSEYYGRSSVRQDPSAKPVMSFGKGDYVVLVWEHDDKDASGKAIKYNTYDILLVRERQDSGALERHEAQRFGAGRRSISRAAGPPPSESLKNSPEEQKNETFVLNMYRDVLQYHHFDLAPKYMAADYIQHNPSDPQGRDPLIEELSQRFKPEPLQPEMKNEASAHHHQG